MTDTDASNARLSWSDQWLLSLLGHGIGGPPAAAVGANLFDLEHVAHIIDGNQPEMVFQPIVELAGGATVGYEALARFRVEPRRSPDVWFAQASRVGLGVELETKAVGAALAAFGDIPDGRFLSVNVSAPTLCSSALEATLEPAPAERVVIELTEHSMVQDYEQVRTVARRYRAKGTRIAVDDAGSGCADLRHILELEPDVIKVDRALIHAIDLHAGRGRVLRSLTALSRALGATILAEGVETEAELGPLVEAGVELGQGYLFGAGSSRPWAPNGTPHGGGRNATMCPWRVSVHSGPSPSGGGSEVLRRVS